MIKRFFQEKKLIKPFLKGRRMENNMNKMGIFGKEIKKSKKNQPKSKKNVENPRKIAKKNGQIMKINL